MVFGTFYIKKTCLIILNYLSSQKLLFTVATEREKLARWAFLDQLLSKGVFMSQKEIMEAYHGNPNTHIDPASVSDTISRLYRPSLRKDLDKFKSALEKEGKRDMLECSRAGDDHRKLSYRYKEPGFSVMPYLTGGMTDGEYRTLVGAINKLQGVLNPATFEEVRFAVQSRMETDYEKGPVYVDYEDNRRLKGREYRPLMYRAITEKRNLHIVYRKYDGMESEFDFHPYLLKQYNERWFVFGCRKGRRDPYTSIPLDRIVSAKAEGDYSEDRPGGYLDYFQHRVGVSRKKGESVRHIVIRISDMDAWGRVTTKPLPTQKVIQAYDRSRGYGLISLDVIPNIELYTKILSWGVGIEILEDESVRSEFLILLEKISGRYPELKIIGHV